jgi:hypothetical protein
LNRGCAFVSFETQQQADAATAALHGVYANLFFSTQLPFIYSLSYRCEGMHNPLQVQAPKQVLFPLLNHLQIAAANGHVAMGHHFNSPPSCKL